MRYTAYSVIGCTVLGQAGIRCLRKQMDLVLSVVLTEVYP